MKSELKTRGLPTTGNKTELVERLQLAIHGGVYCFYVQLKLENNTAGMSSVHIFFWVFLDSSLSLDETVDEILDEDAVLGVRLD